MRKTWLIIISCGLLGLFIFALTQLFILRFERGDVYPPYSSLRADPLGTRIVLESLKGLKTKTIQQNFDPISRVTVESNDLFLYLGVHPDDFRSRSREFFDTFHTMVQEGGHVLITFVPIQKKGNELNEIKQEQNACQKCKGIDKKDDDEPIADDTEGPEEKDEQEDKEEGDPYFELVSIGDYWGVHFGYALLYTKEDARKQEAESYLSGDKKDDEKSNESKSVTRDVLRTFHEGPGIDQMFNKEVDLTLLMNQDQDQGPRARLVDPLISNGKNQARDIPFPEFFSWHTSLHFQDLDPSWQVLYTWNDQPVMIAKKIGQGMLILCADSFFLSNEALWKERETQLLTALFNPYHAIIFDESHFGVVKNIGIIDLMIKYRLVYFLFGFMVFVGLFIWKNSSSLIPPQVIYQEGVDSGDKHVSKKDYGEGLTNLLRRNVSYKNILQKCFEEWQKNLLFKTSLTEDKKQQIHHIIQRNKDKDIDAVEGYRSIHRILSEGKKYGR